MKLLADSDFLFGLFVDVDAHHANCVSFLKKIIKNKDQIVILNLVIHETATVISNKRSQSEAILFLNKMSKMPIEIINIGEDDETSGWEIFKRQTKKGTSFVDCANLAVVEKYKLSGILSFDKFYPKNVRVV